MAKGVHINVTPLLPSGPATAMPTRTVSSRDPGCAGRGMYWNKR